MKKRAIALTLVCAMLVMVLAGCGCSKGSTKTTKYKVGVIQLVQHEALDAATKGFQDALKAQLGDDVEIEVQNASNDSAMCATIANQYASDKVDLIMANATPALQAAVQATGTIPILGTSVTDYATALEMKEWNGKTGINVSGTSDLAPLEKQADMLEELYPASQNKNVGVLYCTAEPNSEYQASKITKVLEGKGYTVKTYTFADSNDVASVTTNACASSDVIYIPTDNTAASCAETIGAIVTEKKVPVIAGEEGICAACGVATLSISYYDLGYATGLQAVEILYAGKDIKDMEIKTADSVTKKYNEDICNKLGVKVPSGYEKIVKEDK